jgi:hypothetical protein
MGRETWIGRGGPVVNQSRRHRKANSRGPVEGARLDRAFVSFLLVFIVMVALLQASLRFDSVRRLLNESIRLEGLPLGRQMEGLRDTAYPWLDWPPASEIAPTGTLYLRLLGGVRGEVWVLVNGRAVRALAADGGTVAVKDGDYIEVMSLNGPVRVVVSSVSGNVVTPAVGDHCRGQGTVFLCRASLR